MPNPIEKMAAKGAGKVAAIGARAKGLTGVFNTLAEQHHEAAVLLKRAEGVDDDFLTGGDYELVVAMERTPAKIHLEPLYDPAGARVKA